jgi:hypothetical protein
MGSLLQICYTLYQPKSNPLVQLNTLTLAKASSILRQSFVKKVMVAWVIVLSCISGKGEAESQFMTTFKAAISSIEFDISRF